jgi:hypothetical protein
VPLIKLNVKIFSSEYKGQETKEKGEIKESEREYDMNRKGKNVKLSFYRS